MGSLEAFRRSRARRARETSANRGENTALGPAMGRSMRTRMLHCEYWAGITALTDWDGHHAAALVTHRCNQWHRDARSTGSSDDPPKCRSTAGCYPPLPHPTASRALLLQTTDIPAETARLVRCHNPWPSGDVYFCPEDALPAFVTGVPALSSGSKIWIAIHNHHPEPLRLHSGQNIGVLEVVTVADTPSSISKPGPMRQPPVPEHLSPLQQQQLNGLFKEFSDVFSPGEDDLGDKTQLLGGRDGAGPAKAGQRRHPALQQPLGVAGSNGKEKRL